ncbi:MAG: hypothetical protein ABIC68_00355 [Candidatus Omnitrophota bacterium]
MSFFVICTRKLMQKKAQMTFEYAAMFVALVAVIVVASAVVLKPTTNKFYIGIGNLVENATMDLQEQVTVSRIAFIDPSKMISEDEPEDDLKKVSGEIQGL